MKLDDLILIANVTEHLYAGDRVETKPSNARITPTVIQDFSGVIKSIYQKDSEIITTEHASIDDAIKFVTDSFGVTVPIVKFLKGTASSNGNGKEEKAN